MTHLLCTSSWVAAVLNDLPELSRCILTRPSGDRPMPWVLSYRGENWVQPGSEHGTRLSTLSPLIPLILFATHYCKEHWRWWAGRKKNKQERKKERNACQNPDISDSKARSLGPSGPMSGTSCLLPTLMASPGWELPHVATWTHSSNSASCASNHIWLSWNQKDIWGQVIFICTKCLLGTLQEMVPHGTNRHDVTHNCLVVHMETLVSTWKH